MLSKNAKVEAIRRVPLFAECTKSELAEIAGIADELRFEEGRTLISEGDTGRECIVVVDGEVEVRRNGRKVPQRGDSSLFGEIALITGSPRNATVTTTSPVRALVITDRAFDNLMRGAPKIQAKVMRSLAARLDESSL